MQLHIATGGWAKDTVEVLGVRLWMGRNKLEVLCIPNNLAN